MKSRVYRHFHFSTIPISHDFRIHGGKFGKIAPADGALLVAQIGHCSHKVFCNSSPDSEEAVKKAIQVRAGPRKAGTSHSWHPNASPREIHRRNHIFNVQKSHPPQINSSARTPRITAAAPVAARVLTQISPDHSVLHPYIPHHIRHIFPRDLDPTRVESR